MINQTTPKPTPSPSTPGPNDQRSAAASCLGHRPADRTPMQFIFLAYRKIEDAPYEIFKT